MKSTLLAAIPLLLCAACGGSDSAQRDNVPRIALIMKSLANEFFVTMADGARAHQTEHANQYQLIVNGLKDESDIAQQVALVEQMVSLGVDAIVIAPADSKALVPALARAQASGTVVVNIDNKLDAAVLADSGVAIPFVGPNNRAGARAVGEALAADLEAGARVAIVGGIPTAFNAQQRQQGFEDAMSAAAIEVIDTQSGAWEQAKASMVASALISAHPDLQALLCANDNMALGAAAAIQQAGKTDQIALVGFDNISAVHPLLRDGRLLATADQHADRLAVFGIEAALQVLRGETEPQDRETPVDLVTAASLKE